MYICIERERERETYDLATCVPYLIDDGSLTIWIVLIIKNMSRLSVSQCFETNWFEINIIQRQLYPLRVQP